MFRRLLLSWPVISWLVISCLVLGATTTSLCAQPPDPIDGPPLHPQLVRLPPVEPAAVSEAAGEEVAVLQGEEELPIEPAPVELAPVGEVDLWEGSFELGLNGAEGNTKTFNLRFGVDAKRKTPQNILTLDLDYHKTDSNYVETANRAFLDSRLEQLYGNSRWTSFVHNTVDYDEFQAFDVRWAADLGLGFRCIKSEPTTLAARFGVGVSHEVGSPDDSYVPEAVFGLDFEHKLTDRQKLTASTEYTPDMAGFNDFRLRTRASWEALIDQQMNLSLKFSVTDRYDSTPNGVRPNDLDYSAMLLWKF